MSKPKIFISYSKQDIDQVRQLYHQLSNAGFTPWMDEKDIIGGEAWEPAIQRAIKASDFFLACLSRNSVGKRGMIQKELRAALEVWKEKLEDDIYLIPARLEECQVPEPLGKFQWIDLFQDDGWIRLTVAIKAGIQRLEFSNKYTPINQIASKDNIQVPAVISRARPQQATESQDRPIDILGQTLQFIEQGKCIIGAPGMTKEREIPDFYIDKFPITNKLYQFFVHETGHEPPFYNAEWATPYNWFKPTWRRQSETSSQSQNMFPKDLDNHPVVLISMMDAIEFCEWRSQKTGKKFRLPTSEEWEKAARGRNGNKYPWGNIFNQNNCNLLNSGIGHTTPVTKYQHGCSPYNVIDMLGNIWEWTELSSGGQGANGIVRGGSWQTPSILITCAEEKVVSIDTRSNDIGFRCVVSSL